MSSAREEARLLARMGAGFGMQSDKTDGNRVNRHVQASIDKGCESALNRGETAGLSAEVMIHFILVYIFVCVLKLIACFEKGKKRIGKTETVCERNISQRNCFRVE